MVLKVLQLILLPYSHMCDALFPVGLTPFLSGFCIMIAAKFGDLRGKRQMAVKAPETFKKLPELENLSEGLT